jgi:cytochrome c oxidase subunit 2
MKLGKFSVLKFTTMAVMVIAAVLVAGCGSLGGDQNTFSPSGEVAQKQLDLFIIVLIPAIIILIGVSAALLYILFRFRAREGDAIPEQTHGNNRLEIGWTILPTVLLMGLAIPTILMIFELGGSPDDDALNVRVVAFQWDWAFEYTDAEYADEDGKPFTTKDLYIPVDRDVNFELEALDVIHSFWVPKLAGKQDIMPGRTNGLWFNATETGVFKGQCAEFCGIGHAGMRFDTTALEPADFEACLAEIATNGESPIPDKCVP